jgi:SNF2 family DNA or RNA helicase
MIVLHAGVVQGRFLLWGETPAPANGATTAPRGRKPKVPQARPLPFAAAVPDLLGALAAIVPSPAPRKGPAESATVWLPTVRGTPIASTPLIAEPPETTTDAELAPWTVPAVALTPAQAVDLLAACLDEHTLASGVVAGTTLAFWGTCLRFAGALVAREQFLPDVEPGDPTWRAAWKPVLSGSDSQRFQQLARAMPPACRALSADAEAAPTTAAATLLAEVLALLVDALVRSGLASAPLAAGPRRQARRPAFDSIHDQWLYALRAPDGTLHGTDRELGALAEQVRAWKRPVAVALAAPFRLSFRLEEPEANGAADRFTAAGTWNVRYLLQAQDDPSLLIPAADAWSPRGRAGLLLQRTSFQPREYLLTALGQAAGLCPPIEASLKAAEPAGFTADSAGAHRFLTETSSLLEQAGFGVLLPAWWTRKGTKQRLALTAHVKSPPMQGGGNLSLEEIVKFDWKVALGDEPLTLRELEALARLKSPLVKVRGQWVQVSAEEIEAALAFWKEHGGARTRVRDLVKMALGAAPAPAGLNVQSVEASGWVGDLLAELEGKASFAELPAPTSFQGTLRPYQVRGYSWLAFLRRWGLGSCLADDMGLGKTIQALALFQREREAGERRPVLLVCPMSVVGNWKKEAERFTPELPVLVHHGQQRARGASFAREAKRHALVLSSYALLHRDLDHLQKVEWAGVVLDEAQNVKNPNTKQAQAARALTADYRIALTGTPVENHVGDLWSIWQFLNPGFLGNQAEFRRGFFVPIQVQHDAEATRRLQRLTGPFLLRRLKTDKAIIADLPDKLEMKVYCNLTREQASLYAAVVEELQKGLDGSEGIQRKGLILGALSKLKQVCNHPAHFLGDNSPIPERSGKLARLTEMLEEVHAAGDRALVFTQFTEMGQILRKHLQESFGREVLFLHGGVSRKERDRLVGRFQEPSANGEAPRIFLLSLKAGGTGLNLTAANHVFHFDRWWNPAVENQATDRAFRIGQRRNVQVHKFVCVGTLEEKIDEMIERKQAIAARVVGTGEAWLTELSNEQLRDLFALRPEAIGG